MIPIKIKDRKYKIKAIHELNTAEFIELSSIDGIDMIKYIAWQTQTNLDEAFFAITSKSVETAIGVIPDIQKMPRSKHFDYTRTIQTVGQRHQVEKCKYEGYALLVFCLAVAQAQSNNIDEVESLRSEYLLMPFTEVLPAGFFFYKNLQAGKRQGMKLLKRLLCSIKIRKSKRAQEYNV